MKGKSHIEVYLLLNAGFTPLEIHKRFNYPKSTCYYYFRRFKKAQEILLTLTSGKTVRKNLIRVKQ